MTKRERVRRANERPMWRARKAQADRNAADAAALQYDWARKMIERKYHSDPIARESEYRALAAKISDFNERFAEPDTSPTGRKGGTP